MVVWVDDTQLLGWYFLKEGQYHGDGTQETAYQIYDDLGVQECDD